MGGSRDGEIVERFDTVSATLRTLTRRLLLAIGLIAVGTLAGTLAGAATGWLGTFLP